MDVSSFTKMNKEMMVTSVRFENQSKAYEKGRSLTLILFRRLQDVTVCVTGNMPRLSDGL